MPKTIEAARAVHCDRQKVVPYQFSILDDADPTVIKKPG